MFNLSKLYVPDDIAINLEPMEYITYGLLRKFLDKDFKAFPSIQEMCQALKRTRNTVRKYLRQLEYKGFISIRERIVEKVIDGKVIRGNISHEYTFFYEKYNKKTDGIKDTTPKIESDTDLNIIKQDLEKDNDHTLVQSAINAMKRNIRAGFPVFKKKNYLQSIIDTLKGQLEEVNKVIPSKNESKPNNNYPKPNKGQVKPKTSFHNFKGRTGLYTAEQLEEMARRKREEKTRK